MRDKIYIVYKNWSIASDGLQWILQKHTKRKGGNPWNAVSFVRTTKENLERCCREKDCPQEVSEKLLSSLPDTFNKWADNAPKSQLQPFSEGGATLLALDENSSVTGDYDQELASQTFLCDWKPTGLGTDTPNIPGFLLRRGT